MIIHSIRKVTWWMIGRHWRVSFAQEKVRDHRAHYPECSQSGLATVAVRDCGQSETQGQIVRRRRGNWGGERPETLASVSPPPHDLPLGLRRCPESRTSAVATVSEQVICTPGHLVTQVDLETLGRAWLASHSRTIEWFSCELARLGSTVLPPVDASFEFVTGSQEV